MAAGNRANDGEQKKGDYELGDLELVPSRRASVPQPSAPLPANDQRAAPARTGGVPRNLTLADDAIGPALELDLPSAPARGTKPRATHITAPATPTAKAAAPAAVTSFGRDALDDDFEQGGFAKLPAIEVEQVERRSNERVTAKESLPDETKRKELEESTRVVELAAYGSQPQGIIACARYAVHVTTRIIALHRGRKDALGELKKRADELHDAFVTMGSALMKLSADKRLEPLRSKVAKVLDEQSKVEAASTSVERTRGDNQRAVSALDEEAAQLRKKLEPYVARERDALAAQRKADEEVRRAQAMLKRVEIELRAIVDAGTNKDPGRILALNEQQEQRRGVVDALTPALMLANDELGQARRELALQRGALDALEERRKQLNNEAAAREATVEGQKKMADGALSHALRELAEGAREQKLTALVQEPSKLVSQREQAWQEANTVVNRHDRALKLYDKQAVIKGYVLMVGIFAALIALFVMRR